MRFSFFRQFSHSFFLSSFQTSSALLLFAVAFDLFLLLLLVLSSSLLFKLFTRFIYFETLSIHCNELLHTRTFFSLSLFRVTHTLIHTQIEHSFQFVQLLFVCYNCERVYIHVHVPKRKYHLKIVQSHAFRVFIFILISLSLSILATLLLLHTISGPRFCQSNTSLFSLRGVLFC